MAKALTGIDIIEVSRVEDAINNLGDNFLNRIFTENEIDYCNKSKKMKYQHFAARFAAKEAVFKALSNEIKSRDDLVWKQIEVISEESGRPKVNMDLLKTLNISKNIESIDISLSHIAEFAVASVVVILN